MTHLTPDELIDAVEGLLPPDRQSHLATCDACRREVADLSAVLGDAKQVSVPEPSPLFWQHFSDRVRSAIDAEPVAAGGRAAWLRWPVFAPIAALAVLVAALVVTVPMGDDRAPDTGASIELAAPDDNWVMVAELVGDLDWETAHAAGVAPRPGAVEQAVLDLSPEEQQALTRLLIAELTRAKS